jgi:hypothetical protein
MPERYIVTCANRAKAYHSDKQCFRIEYHDLDECPDCANEDYRGRTEDTDSAETEVLA